MPIYEYRCQECGVRFDARRSMKDADAPIVCPACGASKARREVSLFFAAGGSGSLKGMGGESSCATCSSSSCAACRGH
ncbi:MAG TPA: zinc ribbon domain-containing protein [Anaerolineae bacterium]|nr:zinc ribbon domain-containing protein [Anaerolineae bacterium]HQH37701.1 zinc ribbon domain-containing protein [Anaerolineae bacterium]